VGENEHDQEVKEEVRRNEEAHLQVQTIVSMQGIYGYCRRGAHPCRM
jgi:hypothetical protein